MSPGFMRRVRVTSRYRADDLSPTLVPWSVERPGTRTKVSGAMGKLTPSRPSGAGGAARLRRDRTEPAASPLSGLDE